MVVSLVMVERRVRPWWPNPLVAVEMAGVPPPAIGSTMVGVESHPNLRKKKKKKKWVPEKKKKPEKEVRETTHTRASRACASLPGPA
ncbi:hypothetical protein Syun_022623 [Stephania yunnanensis]|uniref:Uncharacterized protein n=1 Tax=Stephania yunnanensis TaxID=152371 RepID=A0AAP0FA08_9MAGN